MIRSLTSVAFAVAWTAGLWWWNAPLETGPALFLVLIGSISGLLVYWVTETWFPAPLRDVDAERPSPNMAAMMGAGLSHGVLSFNHAGYGDGSTTPNGAADGGSGTDGGAS